MLTNEGDGGDYLTVEQQQQQRSNMSALNEHEHEDEENASEVDFSERSAKIEESVKELGQRLNSLKLKRTSSGQITATGASEHDVSTNEPTYTSTPVLTPVKEHERYERGSSSRTGPGSLSFSSGNEKLLLMRQQLEENKARFARRSTSNKQLMQIVTKMKEKMGVTQQSLLETTELRRSMTDLTSAGSDPTDPRDRHRSATDLSSRGSINIDRERNKYLENRVRLLEKQLNKERSTVSQAQERILFLERSNEELEQSNISGSSGKVQVSMSTKETATDDVIVEEPSQTNDDFEDQVKLEMAKEIQNLKNLLAQQQDSIKSTVNDATIQSASADVEQQSQSRPESKVDDNNLADRLSEFEATIEGLRKELSERDAKIKDQEESLAEKVIELNILNANVKVLGEKLANSNKNKSIFLSNDEDANYAYGEVNGKKEVQQLKQKLDENNKAMIKLKLKVKQYEKQEKQRLNESKTEMEQRCARLELTNNELQQKITELEDEKGHWQLEHIDEASSTSASVSVDISKQQAEAIRLLEEQKLDLQEDLKILQQEKDAARVKSELTEAQMEEQLANRVKELERENLEKVQSLEKKLSHYISENMELLDKIEKLSKSSSSAESIEIVERLTQQERAELDEFNKRLTSQGESDSEDVERDATAVLPSLVSELTQTDLAPEVSESLAQLREESTELKNKVELFTNERREVLEKMERLTEENASLAQKLEELNRQNDELKADALQWASEKSKLEKELEETEKENEQLSLQVSESSVQKAKLSQELTSMQKSSEVVAALDTDQGATLFDKCEKSLSKLNSELEAYRKANDKNSKFNVSKKLAKEAKNVHMQLSELLQKVKEASNAVETVTVVETVVAVTAPNGKALAEYEQLTAQNSELKARVVDLQRELAELRDSESLLQHHAITATDESRQASKSESDNREEEEEKLRQELNEYEQQCTDLQSTVEDLRLQLEQAKLSLTEKTEQFTGEQKQLKCQLNEKEACIHDLELKLTESDERVKKEATEDLSKLQNDLRDYEDQCAELQDRIETLTEELRAVNVGLDEKSEQIRTQSEELSKLNQQIEDADKQNKAKALSYENQIEYLTRMRRELEGKCDTYEGEMAIFRTLIAEQKQQLIESFSESEHKMNLKLLELQQCKEEISQLRSELKENQQRSASVGEQLTKDLSIECETLRESLRVNKALAAQQVHELSNKQETIETLNQQIIDIYKSMEDSANQAFDKEEQFRKHQKTAEAQRLELETLRRGQEEQKIVVDKLLNELHTHKANIPQLEAEVQSLTLANAELVEQKKNLELRSKDQREKLKKYAANLKKRTVEYQELEKKMKDGSGSAQVDLSETSSSSVSSSSLETINELNVRIEILSEKSEKLEQALTESKSTISKLNEDLKHKIHVNLENRDTIKKIMHELKEKSNEVVELKEKVANLAVETTAAPIPSSNIIDELKEQLQKQMDETARLSTELNQAGIEINQRDAHLVQLRQQISELVGKAKAVEEEVPMQKLQQSVNLASLPNTTATAPAPSGDAVMEQTIADLKRQLESKSTKFEKSKEVIKNRNQTIQKLQLELRELRDKLSGLPEEEALPMVEYKQRCEALRLECDELIADKASFVETSARLTTLHQAIQAKLQEEMAYSESLENENGVLKTKLAALEESMSRNADAIEHMKSLEEQLATYKAQSKRAEEDLVSQIKSLSEHDTAMSEEQKMAHLECDELRERLKNLQSDYQELSTKHRKIMAENESERARLDAENASAAELLNATLKKQNAELEGIHRTYKAQLAAKAVEFDEMESEMTEHMDRVSAEKRVISDQLEKSKDECTKHLDEIMRLCDSLHMMEQAKAEVEREVSWLRLQQEGAQHDQLDMQEMRMQAMQDKTEIDNLRNQIDTLTTNHNQQILSLRQQLDDFDTLGQNQTDDQVFIENQNARLTELLAEKQATLESYFERNGDLQRQLLEKTELLARLQHELQTLQTEMTEVRQQGGYGTVAGVPMLSTEVMAAPSMFFDSEQAVPSPFDEIIQPRSIASQLGASVPVSVGPVTTAPPTCVNVVGGGVMMVPQLPSEQPTIEDLQRNVSDLEKHAQDLEAKLIARTQLVADYEERLREYTLLEQQNRLLAERKFMEMHRELEERDLQLRQLAATQVEVHSSDQQRSIELSTRLGELETELRARNQEIAQLKATLEERERLEAINKQIQVSDPLEAQAPTLDMFFGTTTDSKATADGAAGDRELGLPQAEPVVEDTIVPKKAYVCHPSDGDAEKPVGSAFDDQLGVDWGVDDDPWANAAESSMDPTITTTTHVTNQVAVAGATASSNYAELEAQLQQQQDKIQQLLQKLDSSEQQKQELHLKSMKLMKKIKEMKHQQQQQQQQQQSNLNDLDAAICDELKRQVDLLEAQLVDMKKSNESEALEKEKLKKRIDMLTAGNDRMSEMKEKQDRDVQMYQARIRELQDQLNRLGDWDGANSGSVGGGGEQQQAGIADEENHAVATPTSSSSETTATTQPSSIDQSVHEARVNELQSEIQDLNNECQELRVLLQEEKSAALQARDTINALQEQLSVAKEAKSERTEDEAKQYQQLEAAHHALQDEKKKIAEELNDLKMQFQTLKENYEHLLQQYEELQEKLQEKDNEWEAKLQEQQQQQQNEQSSNSNSNSHKIDEYVALVQEKDSEIMHLKQRIDDLVREDQTEKLVLEILAKNQELQMLKLKLKEVEEDKQELLESFTKQQEQQLIETTSTPSIEDVQQLETINQQLKTKVFELEAKTQSLNEEKTNMEEELRVLNDHVLKSLNMEDKIKEVVLELDAKNIQIAELRKSLESKQQVSATDHDCQQVVEEKCSELGQQWRDYMEQREASFKTAEMELRKQIEQLNSQLNSAETEAEDGVSTAERSTGTGQQEQQQEEGQEQLQLLFDKDTEGLVAKLKRALEDQEVEIVGLKEQLAIRSAEYGRLAARHDPFQLNNSTAPGGSDSEGLQRKLDKALYMLHQRDMRCEEMTIELGQLLTERDTLQLKLSNTLRQMESIKAHTNYLEGANVGAISGPTTTATSTAFTDSSYKAMTADVPYSGTTASGVAAATELKEKLSQLQTVNHSKDKAIVEEREQRERDMGQLQKEVAKIPPANISPQAMDADLSSTNRSPSTTILNWLMGNNNTSGSSTSSSSSYKPDPFGEGGGASKN